MASVLHEALVEMLRESPQLVEALLRAAGFPCRSTTPSRR